MGHEWKTSIGHAEGDKTFIRGYELGSLLSKYSFTEIIFLEWTGVLPTKKENEIFSAILSSAIEHGLSPPSITAARIAYSGSGSYIQALSAGVLATGQYHGGAGEQAAKIFQESLGKKSAKELVADFLRKNERIPGFGHKIYTEEDPRVTRLVSLAKEKGISLKHTKFAYEIQEELEKQTSKKLPLNIDGGTAALMSDLGLHWRYGSAIFVVPRAFGITAHIVEEATEEKPFRRLSEDEVSFSVSVVCPKCTAVFRWPWGKAKSKCESCKIDLTIKEVKIAKNQIIHLKDN